MKKIVSALLAALTLCVLLTGCGKEKVELGSSDVMLTLDDGYQQGKEVKAEEDGEGQIGYYYNTDAGVDFDIYQWAKRDGETLESFTAEEAAKFGVHTEIKDINGVQTGYFAYVEKYDMGSFITETYVLDSGDEFVEAVFCMDGDNPAAREEVNKVIGSLAGK